MTLSEGGAPNLSFVQDGSTLLEIVPSVTVYRTSEFYSEVSGDTKNLCAGSAYCDIHVFSFTTSIHSPEMSFSKFGDSLPNATKGNGSPGLSMGDPSSPLINQGDPVTFFGDYAWISSIDDGYDGICGSRRVLAIGGYFDTLNLSVQPVGGGFDLGDYFPKTDSSLIYSATNSTTTTNSFTLGAGLGTEDGKGSTGSLPASYTTGTSSSDSTTVSYDLMDLSGSQDFKTSKVGDTTCSSSDESCYILTKASISGAPFPKDEFDVLTYLSGEYTYYYPSFKSGASVLPGNVHTEEISFTSTFVLVEPQSAIEADTGTEKSVELDWDLTYQYIFTVPNCFEWGAIAYNESFGWKGEDTAPVIINYTSLPSIEDSAPMTELTSYLNSLGVTQTVVDIIATLDSAPNANACSSGSVFEETVHPSVASWTAHIFSSEIDLKPTGFTSLSTDPIDTEAECRTVCSVTDSCYWAKWEQAEGDVARRCYHSTNNCASINLTTQLLSCQDSSNVTYYFTSYKNSSEKTVTPYTVTIDSSSEFEDSKTLSGGCE